ncbi:MAG: ATP-grasp domain-containing protein, partial [Rhodospirillales bacterium]|nr:ATP-grasp domain-containing protein [Rhodospirillales bacterium]
EISVIVARSPRGEIKTFGPIENEHVNHILDLSIAPANVSQDVAEKSVELATTIAEEFGLEGLICIEMFLTREGELLINEMAPRPHNSGHLTIEGCATSQFEQQVRAMCNLPLGTMTLHRPAAMANLLDDFWQDGEPNWAAVLEQPGVALHLYGKDRPRPGRKMGHLTATASCTAQAAYCVTEARRQLRAGNFTSATPKPRPIHYKTHKALR